MRLPKEFYLQSAETLAPLLLGKLICVQKGSEVFRYRITETECYQGEDDTACHAHKGKTPRTEIMYREGGYAYIYLCYGMHHLLNIVTGEKDVPQAVLIRGVEQFPGPGRATKAMGITKDWNGEDLCSSKRFWLEDDGTLLQYQTGKRIGIDYAEPKDRERPWRFFTTI
ncbi:MAG: DNA-3-methyladenine glycosylase [Ruminococcaceae bacterium]|nr:DNA-3-methyladenine glycosylase [Oscillospiraceae bacterium]